MRLSFGQELRLVQKQVLAPRMIQSMEILQLPIMALQERIEQEMQENRCSNMQEEDPGSAGRSKPKTENPDAPTPEERELVVDETKDNEDDFERLMNMDEEWPDHFEERAAPSSTRDRRGRRPQARRHGQHGRPAAIAARLFARSARLVRSRRATAADVRPDHLQPRPQRLSARPAGRSGRSHRPGRSRLALAEEALAVVQKLDPPGVAARDLQECLLLQLVPGMPYYEQLKTLITQSSGRHRAQPPAGDRAPHRLLDRADQPDAGASCGS